MLQFLQWTILRMLWVKDVFSFYLSIHGLRKGQGPEKFLTGVLEMSWIFCKWKSGNPVLVFALRGWSHVGSGALWNKSTSFPKRRLNQGSLVLFCCVLCCLLFWLVFSSSNICIFNLSFVLFFPAWRLIVLMCH